MAPAQNTPSTEKRQKCCALVLSKTEVVSKEDSMACSPMKSRRLRNGIIEWTMKKGGALDDNVTGYKPRAPETRLIRPTVPFQSISVSMSPFDRETMISSVDSVNNTPNRPRLQRRDANRPFPRIPYSTSSQEMDSNLDAISCHPQHGVVSMDPEAIILRHNFSVLRSFKRKPFLIYGENVLKAFIRRNESQLNGRRVIPGIIEIVASYYVDGEAGIFQFGHKLHRILKKAKRRGVSLKMVRALMEKYLSQKASVSIRSNVDIEFCCDELVRLGYLVPIQKRSSEGRSIMIPNNTANGGQDGEWTLYRIPMDKVLEFTCLQQGDRERVRHHIHWNAGC